MEINLEDRIFVARTKVLASSKIVLNKNYSLVFTIRNYFWTDLDSIPVGFKFYLDLTGDHRTNRVDFKRLNLTPTGIKFRNILNHSNKIFWRA